MSTTQRVLDVIDNAESIDQAINSAKIALAGEAAKVKRPALTVAVRRAAATARRLNARAGIDVDRGGRLSTAERRDLERLGEWLRDWLAYAQGITPKPRPRLIRGHGAGAELAQLQRPTPPATSPASPPTEVPDDPNQTVLF